MKHAKTTVKPERREESSDVRMHRHATTVALAVASCFAVSAAQANPTNPVVARGAASFTQAGNLLTVTNSPNTIINWGSFSIGANEITRFVQQSSASVVLNRVGAGGNPSAILGALQSNGRVFLINPNGITFGAGSQINVAGLVASTLNLSDADFLAGRMRFTDGLGNSVINNGNIATGNGGSVYLVGNAVTNNGIITSPKGEVVLAAGNSVELVNPGTPDLRVEIVAPDNQAVNLGEIVANSGRVGIYAGLITHGGTMNANSVDVDAAGNITLRATKNVDLVATSRTTASGQAGGNITVQSGDTTLAAGTIEAKGSAGQGGTVKVLGNQVGLTGNASIDVSGETGGGTVLVGGDFQGKNSAVPNAFRTYVGKDASIKADAISSGNGGKVIVWGDDITRFYGSISARGGTFSGHGGFVETSGKRYLDFRGRVNTLAPNGRAGTLLLDPTDIDIIAGGIGASTVESTTSGTTIFNETTPTNTSTITDQDLLAALFGGDVIINSASVAGGNGDITFSTPFSYATGTALTLNAVRDINVTSGNPLTNTDSGAVSFNAGRNININAAVTMDGGDLTLVATSGSTNVGAALNVATGNITATGGSGVMNFAGPVTVTANTFTAGTVNALSFSNVALVTTAQQFTNFNLTNATVTFNTNLDVTTNMSMAGASLVNGAGNLALTNATSASFNWSGGTISGSGNMTSTGPGFGTGVTTTITGPATLSRNWTMNGAASIDGTGVLTISSGAALTSNNTFTIAGTSTAAAPIAGTGTLNLNGTLSELRATQVDMSSVTLNTTLGSTVSNIFGNLLLGPGTDGASSVYATGAGGFMVAANGTRNNTGGAFTGSGFIQTNGGNWNLNGSTIPATMRLAVNTGTMTVDGAAVPVALLEVHTGGTLTGTANLSTTGNLLWDGGVISGTGTLTTSGAGSTSVTGATQLQRDWTATSAVNISGAGQVNVGASKTMTVQASQLNITSPGGTVITGAGTLALSQGALNVNSAGAVTIDPAVFNTGQLTSPSSINLTAGTLRVGSTTGSDFGTTYSGAGSVDFFQGTRTLTNSGIFDAQIQTTAGAVKFTGANVTFGPSAIYNPAGTTEITGGTVAFQMPSLTLNTPTNISGGVLNSSGSITANSTITLGTGAQLNAPGQVIDFAGGVLDINSGAVTASTINVSAGSTFKGIGTVNGSLSNAGTVAPGASPGIMVITGNYTQTSTGTLQIEIGGTTPGPGYDQLQVSGNVNLDGTLAVTQFGTFVPTSINTFMPITTGTGLVSGTFANVVVPSVFTGLGASYQTNSVTLSGATGAAATVALDPRIVNEEKDIFSQTGEDKDIFDKLRDYLVCN